MTTAMPHRLLDFAVWCRSCRASIPLVRFAYDGRPHAQCRCPRCGAMAFLHGAP